MYIDIENYKRYIDNILRPGPRLHLQFVGGLAQRVGGICDVIHHNAGLASKDPQSKAQP